MKQVLIIRKDLNMRKGKMCAMASHAAIDAYLNSSKEDIEAWNLDGHKKICVSCDSEQELIDLYQKAKDENLPCSIVVDMGLTEFHGIPTKTAVAIGPAIHESIDKITGHLKLL